MLLQRFMTEWNIQSRAHGCEACNRPFVEAENFHTLLFEEKSELQRLDICAACWDSQYRESRDRKGFLSYWQSKYEAPVPQKDPIEKETAETLLRKLIERNDPQYIPAGFILAVMLERKRLLKVKEQMIRDGQRVFLYEQPQTGDLFTITDPNLRLDQLEQVQHDVAALLEHGFEPATPAQTAPTPDAPAATQPVPAQPEVAPATTPEPSAQAT
jgi:hypothetical protein